MPESFGPGEPVSKKTGPIGGSPAYPNYAVSTVDWIGELPAHWDVVALKRVAPFVSRGSAPEYAEDETGTPVINQACVYWDGLRLDRVKYDQSSRPARTRKGYLLQGDVLVNSTGTGTLGRAAVFNETGEHIADTHVTIVRLDPTQCEPRYLAYLLATPIYQGFIYTALVSGSTNQIELSREDLRAAPTILPPLEEQRAIAAFLDRETAKIDALIEKKTRLIELAHERVQAQLTRVFEKLNETSRKLSLRRAITSLTDGPFGSSLRSEHYVQAGTRVIRLQNIGVGSFRGDDKAFVDTEYFRSLGGHDAKSGDVLVAALGDENHPVGRACLLPDYVPEAMVKADCFRVRLDAKIIDPEYFVAFMSSKFCMPEISKHVRGATRQRINLSGLSSLRVPAPESATQKQVVLDWKKLSSRVERLVREVDQQISHLREYRTALISAAVTGQIDVRGRG